MRNANIFLFIIIFIGIFSYSFSKKEKPFIKNKELPKVEINNLDFDTIKKTSGFDFPVGKPNAKGYYNAQKFTENNHLGEDWNGINGGNTDFGHPIYSIANGYISFAENIGGSWGNVIRIVHYIDKENQIESLYAHCNIVNIKKGDYVKKGDQIGTIGNNDGQYLAHLHLELRSQVGLPIGDGYSSKTKGYLNPTKFIKKNRK